MLILKNINNIEYKVCSIRLTCFMYTLRFKQNTTNARKKRVRTRNQPITSKETQELGFTRNNKIIHTLKCIRVPEE
jgi:hypothetical protein